MSAFALMLGKMSIKKNYMVILSLKEQANKIIQYNINEDEMIYFFVYRPNFNIYMFQHTTVTFNIYLSGLPPEMSIGGGCFISISSLTQQ